MNKKIKPPALSTAFSENGKSAQKRLENILNTGPKKKGAAILVLALVLIAAAGILIARNHGGADTGIIGGSDGPTSIYVSKNNGKIIKDLYDSRQQYVGNASGVGKILSLLPFAPEMTREKMELQTEKQPYGLIIYGRSQQVEPDRDELMKNSYLLFCLIDNLGYTEYVINDGEPVRFERAELEKNLVQPFTAYNRNWEQFSAFYASLMQDEATDLETATAQAILSKNANSYLKGECAGEGHIILGTGDSQGWYNGDKNIKFIEAYVLTTYGEYGYENGQFGKISGSGIVPVRITFEIYPDGRYNLLEYKQALDGGGFASSVQEMFPEKYWDRVLKPKPTDLEECKKQELVYVQKYLKSVEKAPS